MAKIKGGASATLAEVGNVSRALRVELFTSGAVNIGGVTSGSRVNIISLVATDFSGSTTEGLITFTPYVNFTASNTTTTYTPTNGKRFVLSSLQASTRNNITPSVPQGIVCRVLVNATGANNISDQQICSVAAGTATGSVGFVNTYNSVCFVQISDAWPAIIEVSGTTQVGMSQIGTANAGNDVTLLGYEY